MSNIKKRKKKEIYNVYYSDDTVNNHCYVSFECNTFFPNGQNLVPSIFGVLDFNHQLKNDETHVIFYKWLESRDPNMFEDKPFSLFIFIIKFVLYSKTQES